MFTQKHRYNIQKCDGCEKRCELGYDFKEKTFWSYAEMLPTIAGQCIDNYINPDGEAVVIFSRQQSREFNERAFNNISEYNGLDFKRDFGSAQHRIATIKLARKIAKCCDNYRSKQL